LHVGIDKDQKTINPSEANFLPGYSRTGVAKFAKETGCPVIMSENKVRRSHFYMNLKK